MGELLVIQIASLISNELHGAGEPFSAEPHFVLAFRETPNDRRIPSFSLRKRVAGP